VRDYPLTNVVFASPCISFLPPTSTLPPSFHLYFPPSSCSQCKGMTSSLMLLSHGHDRCVAAGVGLREIEAHLDKRSLKVYTALCLSLYECILSFTLGLSSPIQTRTPLSLSSPLTVLLHSHSPLPLMLTLFSNTHDLLFSHTLLSQSNSRRSPGDRVMQRLGGARMLLRFVCLTSICLPAIMLSLPLLLFSNPIIFFLSSLTHTYSTSK
jgi:hypothetical protein